MIQQQGAIVSSPERTTRIVTMACAREDGHAAPPVVGEVYCLVEWEGVYDPLRRPRREPPWGNELTKDPVTNCTRYSDVTKDPVTNGTRYSDGSRRRWWYGWLGRTDDIDRHARGAWRVVSFRPVDSIEGEQRWKVSLARTQEPS